MSRDRLDWIYYSMKARCYNINAPEYKNYGGRGIIVCEEWRHNRKAFKTWAVSNGYCDNLTIDRIDNNKGYSPDNCRWVDRITQNNNTRRNHYILYNGKRQSLADWCRELNLNYSTIRFRLSHGWTVKKAFEVKNGRIGCKHYEKLITYNGKTQSIKNWCTELNLNYSTVRSRLNDLNYSVEKAFTKKVVR